MDGPIVGVRPGVWPTAGAEAARRSVRDTVTSVFTGPASHGLECRLPPPRDEASLEWRRSIEAGAVALLEMPPPA
jgi:hypothetical protein